MGDGALPHGPSYRAHPRLYVRPEGANHQWRKIPPGELSIDPVADERLGGGTARAGAAGPKEPEGGGTRPWGGGKGWSLVTRVAVGRLSDPAGRNVSEA